MRIFQGSFHAILVVFQTKIEPSLVKFQTKKSFSLLICLVFLKYITVKHLVKEKISILSLLQKLSPESSKNTLKSWVEQGRVMIDGQRITTYRYDLQPGQEVVVGPKVSFSDEGIRILYEDRYLVVIDKPHQLLSVASLDENELTAHTILGRRLRKKVYPVHRLDKDTSGVMMFAYTEETYERLKDQFAEHSIERVYYATVHGIPKIKKGTWKSYLIEDDAYFVKSAPLGTLGGKLAITHYELIREQGNLSLMKFTLETGRKNQIRVQAADAGHPVVGDRKYGLKTHRSKRLHLHAHILGFYHPFKKKTVRFVSPLPDF